MPKAAVMAVAVEVHCPGCGMPHPNPTNGSHIWTVDMMPGKPVTFTCGECRMEFELVPRPTVEFNL